MCDPNYLTSSNQQKDFKDVAEEDVKAILSYIFSFTYFPRTCHYLNANIDVSRIQTIFYNYTMSSAPLESNNATSTGNKNESWQKLVPVEISQNISWRSPHLDIRMLLQRAEELGLAKVPLRNLLAGFDLKCSLSPDFFKKIEEARKGILGLYLVEGSTGMPYRARQMRHGK